MGAHRRGTARLGAGVMAATLCLAVVTDSCASSTSTTTSSSGSTSVTGSSTTASSTSTVATTTSASSGASTTSTWVDQPAAFPATSVRFATPEEAARAFVVQVLKVAARLGPFQQGDTRSGEMDVYGGETTSSSVVRSVLLLRQLGPEGAWFVLAAVNDKESITAPASQATVPAGRLTVTGTGRGFEGTVIVQALALADPPQLLDRQTAQGGSMEQPEPVTVTLDLSKAKAGQTVLLLMQGDTGAENDPGDFSAIPVVIGR